ncbi:MAG: hypothetical protein GW949_06045 [Spirochaetales bacterium]|nr:hypothetical protein [Spirochaetales bacterium]
MEIKKDLELSKEQNTLLVMHSVLNIFNVIIYNLMRLDNAYGNSAIIEELQEVVLDAANRLGNPVESLMVLEEVGVLRARIDQGLDRFLIELREKTEPESMYWEVNDTLLSVYDILGIRSRELLSRKDDENEWVTYSAEGLRDDLVNTFHAVEQNGYGAYKIVFRAEDHDEKAYLVKIKTRSINGDVLRMPRVFQDIIRDLIANSRKYSLPGSTIITEIEDSVTSFLLSVKDEGVGMELSEIEDLVDFGKRGSNTSNRPTRGGGFGLTKAYYFTRAYGGRFWIESELGKGTVIRIEIPLRSA